MIQLVHMPQGRRETKIECGTEQTNSVGTKGKEGKKKNMDITHWPHPQETGRILQTRQRDCHNTALFGAERRH